MIRRVFCACMAVALAGCMALPAGPRASADLCAFEVTEATAWIDRMPGAGRPQLIVVAKVTPADRIRALAEKRVDNGQLDLAVLPGAPPLQPGLLSWRMYLPEEPVRQVTIACNGVEKASIRSIKSVY